MPTYQYACTACGHQLEAVQSFTDDPLTECPACEGRLRKRFNSVGIVFKGSGFYRTDSRSDGSRSSSASTTAQKSARGESTAAASSSTAAAKESANGSTNGSTAKPTASAASAVPTSAGA